MRSHRLEQLEGRRLLAEILSFGFEEASGNAIDSATSDGAQNGTLINGAVDGACRPDDIYYKNLIIPVPVGTNTITFVCGKDANGCNRR